MPRIAYLSKRYSSEELKTRYLTSRDPIEARRWHLVWKVSLGWTIKNSAVAVGLDYEYSKEIIKKYNSQGEEGIKNLKKTVKTKKVWAKIGSRPIAIGNHRYEWLYVYAFVKPKTGETLWYLIPRVNTKWLNLVFENFERDSLPETLRERQKEGVRSRAIIVEDNAGWHRSKKVNIPEAIEIEYLRCLFPRVTTR